MPTIEVSVNQISEWEPTVAQLRDPLLSGIIVGANGLGRLVGVPREAKIYEPTQEEVERANDLAIEALQAGRLIDFGLLPNEVLKTCGRRGGPLWNQGGLAMPFSTPWLLYHRWEYGVALYIVNPMAIDEVEIVELEPLRCQGRPLLSIGDRGVFYQAPEKPDRMLASMVPGALRFAAVNQGKEINLGLAPEQAAGANVGDPLMTALLILNTRNIGRETVRADEKLNRARVKMRKRPIPPYDVVNTALYVTAIQARGHHARGDHQGGTHASPVPHIRMGHTRTHASGKVSLIQDTLVNVDEAQRAAFKSGRSHYQVR